MDIKIINGTIVDGTGQARFKGDIGITEDIISDIGDLSAAEAGCTIDAAGKIVAPGFIDVHTHSDFSIIFDGSATSRLYDGVTSDVIGNCGIGGAPVNDETRDLLRSYLVTRIAGSVPVADLGLKWNSFGEYLEFLDRCPKGINIIPLLSHGAVRIDAMGFSDSKPSRSELERMKRSIRESMEAGACGFSSGLVYLPGMYADAEELTELSRVAAEFGVKYITHMRNEGNTIQEALEEAAAIGRDSGAGLHVSHIKLASPKVWGKADRYIEALQKYAESGLDISYDCYPYVCGMGPLAGQIPGWCLKDGGVSKMLEILADPVQCERVKAEMRAGMSAWYSGDCEEAWTHFWIVNVTSESGKWMEGLSFPELAERCGTDIPTAICQALIREKGKVQIRMEAMLESDMEKLLSMKDTMVGSDSMCMSNEGIMKGGMTHPRAYGTHGIVLRKYVREKGLFTLESAVRKMSALPAQLTRLDRRGLLKENYFADVLVFDEDGFRDNATYAQPKLYSSGMDHVIVNGKVAIKNGEYVSGSQSGRVLRRKGC